jgi:hypothetical protein
MLVCFQPSPLFQKIENTAVADLKVRFAGKPAPAKTKVGNKLGSPAN